MSISKNMTSTRGKLNDQTKAAHNTKELTSLLEE